MSYDIKIPISLSLASDLYCYGVEERIVSIGRKIKNKLAALLLGNDFVILTAEEHQTYISMKQEYERKLAECEQTIQSLQVEQF